MTKNASETWQSVLVLDPKPMSPLDGPPPLCRLAARTANP
jgi:hypothetical protein